MKVQRYAECAECERQFDLFDYADADEWFNGHDCEPVEAEVTDGV